MTNADLIWKLVEKLLDDKRNQEDKTNYLNVQAKD